MKSNSESHTVTFALASAALLARLSLAQSVHPAACKPTLGNPAHRLIVKPRGPVEVAPDGQIDGSASVEHTRAVARLAPFAPRKVSALDLYVIAAGPGGVESTRAILMATGDYEYVERDELVLPAQASGDPYSANQWYLPKIGANHAWSTTTGNSKIIVAALDTGVDLTHPDLAPNLISGYNAVRRIAQSAGGQVADLNGHGTTTAGVIAAAGNNGIGITGVCWHLPFMPVRVSDSAGGGAFVSDIIEGGVWAVAHGARVLYAPYAGVQSPGAQTLGQWAKLNNALLVWSADNASLNYGVLDWPDVLIAAGTDEDDNLASFSSYGLAIDLAAPATNIYTTTRGGTYAVVSGTSYASPMVAGVIALAWGLDPSLSASQMQAILLASCDNIGSSNLFGAGRLNAARTVRQTSQADFNRDGTIDYFDAYDYCIAFEAGSSQADIDHDSSIDFFDFQAFLDLFEGAGSR